MPPELNGTPAGDQSAAPPQQMTAPPSAPPAQPASVAPSSTPPAQAPATQHTVSAPLASAVNVSIRDHFAQQGYDVGHYNDDLSFAQALGQIADQYRDDQPLINYGRQYVQHAAEFQEFLSQRQSQQQAAQQQQQQKQPVWDVPEYDPQWDSLTKWDAETQAFVPVSHFVNPTVAQARNDYQRKMRDGLERLARDPFTVMKEGLGGWIEEQITQRVQAAISQSTADRQNQDYLEKHRDQFYELDANGQIRVDAMGNQMLTQSGRALMAHALEAKKIGITDPTQVRVYAERQLQADIALGVIQVAQQSQQQAQPNQPQGPQAPSQNATEANQQTRARFLDRALLQGQRRPNRGGTAQNPAEVPQNPRLTFGQIAMEEARSRGLLAQTG